MYPHASILTRRNMIRGAVGITAAMFFAPGVFAELLHRTPSVEEGPFYPYNKLPLDSDNDLIIVNNSATPALGEISHIGGRLLDEKGDPIKDALIEIWQCDNNAVYLAESATTKKRDGNFQGYGKFSTSSTGEYRFRTIKPVAYPGRPAAHIHFKISKGREQLLTTQLFVRGFPGNQKDNLYLRLRDPDRELVSTDFKPVKDSKIAEFAAAWDIVLGRTPADPDGH